MNKRLLLLLSFISCIIYCNGQNPLVKQWDYRFGGTDYDLLRHLLQAADGGYVLAGRSLSDSSGNKTQDNRDSTGNTYDYWIVKTDSTGNKLWDKRFGGTNYDLLFSTYHTTDGGYILGGTSVSDSSGDKTQPSWGHYDFWIVKTDSIGNKQWDKRYGGANFDEIYSLQQTTDGGYILGGWSTSDSTGDKTQQSWGAADFWIVKTDSVGNKQWDKQFGGTASDELNSIKQTADGGYILGGLSESGISGDKTQPSWGFEDFWVVKTDSLGNKQWDKRFGGTDSDILYSLQQTSDGGYILGGLSASGISGDKTQALWDTCVGCIYKGDYWIVKIDSIGNKQWDKRFGGINNEDDFGNITQTPDRGYLMAGASYSPISGDKTENNLGLEQSWLVKTDSLGIKQWDKTIFTLGHDEDSYAILTNDGCYTLANQTTSHIGGYKTQPNWSSYYDYWIIKFCDSTLTGSSIVNGQSSVVSIYPNPFTEELAISSGQLTESKIEITVTDIFGRKIYSKAFLSANCQLKTATWNKGIYFVYVYTEKGIEVKKVIK